MDLPHNSLKAALKAGRHQLGIWHSIGGPSVCEHLAGCGFDWMLLDMEHTAYEVGDVLQMLQAIAGYSRTTAVVRPPSNDRVTIKRLLDIGAQSLLIPYVETADEARAAVAATRYSPRGVRGYAGITRATRFGKVDDYATQSEDQICLLVQVETVSALGQLEQIAVVDGVDGVFIGPADLAASMGHPGHASHPDVVTAIVDAIARLKAIGTPSGILSLDREFTKHCMKLGTRFTAVGVDMDLLDTAAVALEREFRAIARREGG